MTNNTVLILMCSGALVVWLFLHLFDMRRLRKQREHERQLAAWEKHRAAIREKNLREAHETTLLQRRNEEQDAFNRIAGRTYAKPYSPPRSPAEMSLPERRTAATRPHVRAVVSPAERRRRNDDEQLIVTDNYELFAITKRGAEESPAIPYEGKGGAFGGAGASASWAPAGPNETSGYRALQPAFHAAEVTADRTRTAGEYLTVEAHEFKPVEPETCARSDYSSSSSSDSSSSSSSSSSNSSSSSSSSSDSSSSSSSSSD